MSEKSDAEETLEDVLMAVHSLSNDVPVSDPRRPMVETILQKVPLDQVTPSYQCFGRNMSNTYSPFLLDHTSQSMHPILLSDGKS